MVKCPKGTIEQINANLAFLKCRKNEENSCFEEAEVSLESSHYEEAEGESFFSLAELDTVRADKRRPPTTEDEIVYLFVNHFLDILLKSWEGKPCLKPKLKGEVKFSVSHSEEEEAMDGEETKSFAMSTENLNEVYKSRSQKWTIPGGTSGLEERLCKRPRESKRSLLSNVEESEVESFSQSEFSWKAVVPDEDVQMMFQNGARYNGRVSRRLMDGEGTFFWEDGASFQGEFIEGTAMGFGRLEFPNQNVYEGTVYKNFRHGQGLQYMSNSPVLYSGEWWLGKKSGQGLIMYSDPVHSVDYYNGSWLNGEKDGFGFRQYPSGAKYIGFWKKGQRHGRGTMFWCNHDIYRGDWKYGLMDGFGEYTWKGFINKAFCYPQCNSYRGFWENGKRNGFGLLETRNPGGIETIWVDNKKDGPGLVICSNVTAIVSETKLFKNNKQALLNEEDEDLSGLQFRNQGFTLTKKKSSRRDASKVQNGDQLLSYFASIEKAKAVSIPIYSPVHTLDLTCHLNRLQNLRKDIQMSSQMQTSSFALLKTGLNEKSMDKIPQPSIFDGFDERYSTEEKLLRYSIMINLIRLQECFDECCTIACAEKPPFGCLLSRFFFWEFLIQAGVRRRHFSLIDIDKIIEREPSFLIDFPHYPFERFIFGQFIHFLITISWYLYGQYVCKEILSPLDDDVKEFIQIYQNQSQKAVIASAFTYFLNHCIFNTEIKKLKNIDLLPLKETYKLYTSIGEPISAKQLLTVMCMKKEELHFSFNLGKFIEKLPANQKIGQNVINFIAQVAYLPKDSPFNFPELAPLEKHNISQEPDLTCFAELGAKAILQCFVQVCPHIMEDDLIVDMEYQITFLEFYKIIILCAEALVKKRALKEMKADIISNYKKEMEEYEEAMKKFESQKETASMTTTVQKNPNSKKTKKN